MRSSQYEKVETRPDIMGGPPIRYIRLRSGRLFSFWDAKKEAEQGLTGLQRGISRMGKLCQEDFQTGSLEHFVSDLHTYVHALEDYLDKLKDKQAQREKIARLRDTSGRSPEEAAAYLRKADELERRLEAE